MDPQTLINETVGGKDLDLDQLSEIKALCFKVHR